MKGVWYKHQSDVYGAGKERFFIAREKGKVYEFAVHESLDHFSKVLAVQRQRAPDQVIYHECIPPWRRRRIHFDIDYDKPLKTLPTLIEHLLLGCEQELTAQRLTFDPTQVWVLDASNTKKTSVHIILSNVVAATYEECAEFCKRVIRNVELSIPEAAYDSVMAIDRNIYQSNRNFRMAYCTKKNQKRPLLPVSFTFCQTTYQHDELESVVLAATVVGVSDEYEGDLVHYDIEKKASSLATRLLTEEDARLAVELVRSTLTPSEWCFDAEKGKDDCIQLNRKNRKGPCRICRRVHDRENSSIYVTIENRVMFKCWAAPSHPEYMGCLGTEGEVKEAATVTVLSRYLGLTRGADTRKTSSDLITSLVTELGYIEHGLSN